MFSDFKLKPCGISEDGMVQHTIIRKSDNKTVATALADTNTETLKNVHYYVQFCKDNESLIQDIKSLLELKEWPISDTTEEFYVLHTRLDRWKKCYVPFNDNTKVKENIGKEMYFKDFETMEAEIAKFKEIEAQKKRERWSQKKLAKERAKAEAQMLKNS